MWWFLKPNYSTCSALMKFTTPTMEYMSSNNHFTPYIFSIYFKHVLERQIPSPTAFLTMKGVRSDNFNFFATRQPLEGFITLIARLRWSLSRFTLKNHNYSLILLIIYLILYHDMSRSWYDGNNCIMLSWISIYSRLFRLVRCISHFLIKLFFPIELVFEYVSSNLVNMTDKFSRKVCNARINNSNKFDELDIELFVYLDKLVYLW
jgi:hypothetical protein